VPKQILPGDVSSPFHFFAFLLKIHFTNTSVQAKLRAALEQNSDVLAAYLFGSVAADKPVRNDVDILVLLREGADRFEVYTQLARSLAEASGLPEGRIDLLFLDLREANPHVLIKAVNSGVLLKNADPKLLSERIEDISMYFLLNEPVLQRAEILKKESLEDFCGTWPKEDRKLPPADCSRGRRPRESACYSGRPDPLRIGEFKTRLFWKT
jgi:predicted nucleotidyltransferase